MPGAGLGVEVVVEGAQQADPDEGRERRVRRGVQWRRGRTPGPRPTITIRSPPIVGRALLDEVAVGALLADLLAEPDVAQQPDVGRHEDDDEREGEEQALDELDVTAVPHAARLRARGRVARAARGPIPRDPLTRTRRRPGGAAGATSSAALASVDPQDPVGGQRRPRRPRRRARPRPAPTTTSSPTTSPRPRRPRDGRPRTPRRARASRRGPRPGAAPAAWPAGRGRRAPSAGEAL